MSRVAVAEYEALLEAAYRAPRGLDGDSHSILGNLETVPPEAWDWLPRGGARSIRDITVHVGGCKYMYADHAFRTRTLVWGAPPADPDGWREMPVTTLLAWLDEGHRILMESVAALSDEDLPRETWTNWGTRVETRSILTTLIAHDHYHAGEINHLRSLFEEADAWAWAEAG